MSGAPILVNSQTISQAAQDIRTTAGNIQGQLDELAAGVSRVAQSWEGSAQTAYRARQAEWDRKAAALRATLEQIAGKLDAAAENYSATERANTSVWHQD
ncbi:WXG100 family type VII secretion target [Kitasatospora sp. NPDC052896]|uniref:WXG100 family type VII secretion target n=1 Tax=Kitasatospora sp. NPDC052896 TaxID=3364061 RepID=UPI0037C97152